jgi:nitrile hydratase subunit beta
VNGVHDMGGMHGMGPIEREANEPVFHHEWERRIFAVAVATGYLRRWNIDMSRHARERMPAPDYLAASYYERWLYGVQLLLAEGGLVSREELAAQLEGVTRLAGAPPATPAGIRRLQAEDVERALTLGSARVDADIAPRFKPGDAVVTRNINPTGHTRLPRYARGKQGVVDRDHGVWVFPDAYAAGQGKKPQHCYSVRFAARELWGSEASARDMIYIDVFEDYLEPA